jgi:hypothetical protein
MLTKNFVKMIKLIKSKLKFVTMFEVFPPFNKMTLVKLKILEDFDDFFFNLMSAWEIAQQPIVVSKKIVLS